MGELVISNEKYSGATGYLPTTATFHSGLSQIRLTSPLMTTQGLTIQGVTGGSYGVGYSGLNLQLAAQSTGLTGPYGVEIVTATGSALLTVPTTNTVAVPNLTVADSLTFSGSGSINSFFIYNITPGSDAVPAGSGVDGTAAVDIVTTNVQFSTAAGASWSTLCAFGNLISTSGGTLTINIIQISAPTNGLDGYCDITVYYTNTTSTSIYPVNTQILLISNR